MDDREFESALHYNRWTETCRKARRREGGRTPCTVRRPTRRALVRCRVSAQRRDDHDPRRPAIRPSVPPSVIMRTSSQQHLQRPPAAGRSSLAKPKPKADFHCRRRRRDATPYSVQADRERLDKVTFPTVRPSSVAARVM